MNKRILLLLPVVALLLTGCPRDEYTVTLTPHGDKIRREVVFYRGETDTNGVVKYESFPQEELAAIMAFYPSNALSRKGEVYTVKGEFTDTTPSDVGGAGNYTILVTSMGSAGFYGEGFRGNDDLAGQAEKRLAAANRLTDLLIGWSEIELGRETNYAALRSFLDTEFRKDLKNASFYHEQANLNDDGNTNILEEYEVRFAQYLMERGYFKPSDAPYLFLAIGDNDSERRMSFVQRLIARKLGVNDTQPVPASLAFLRDYDAAEMSFIKYFEGTDFYRAKASEWKKSHETSDRTPGVDDIMLGQFGNLFDFNLLMDPADHLTVRLSLPGPPTHTNGQWDETNKMVVWKSDIEPKTNSIRLPVTCYASWAQPNDEFQKRRFGHVILTGDDLLEYCLWHASLSKNQAAEWEKLVADLQPGDALKQKIKALRLSDEPPSIETKDEEKSPGYLGRGSIENALDGKSLQGGPSDASKLK